MFINIFAADDCNPEICGKFDCTNFNGVKGSNQIDSLSIIEMEIIFFECKWLSIWISKNNIA